MSHIYDDALKFGCDSWPGMTALCHASLKGRSDLVQLLLSQSPGPNLNLVDDHGSTPLVLAVSSGHHHIVDLLVCQLPPPVIATRREQSIMMGLLQRRGQYALADRLARLPLLNYESEDAATADGGHQLPRGIFSRSVKTEL